MKIKYFGTGAGAGIPELLCSCRVCTYAREHGGKDLRTRSQAAIDDLMIDFSVDAHAHSLFYGMDMRRYRNVLITHDHIDHYIRSELTSRFTDDGEWNFYLPASSAESERQRIARLKESITVPLHDPPRRFVSYLDAKAFSTIVIGDNYIVTPLPANHVKNIECLLYLISHNGKTVFWVHDSGLLPDETVRYLKEHPVHMDAVSLDCTLRKGSTLTAAHMDILNCQKTADLLRSIGCADEKTIFLLSHIGHLSERTHAELENEAAELGFIVAYDKMEIEV
jgi:phosphoribosyl 1,2-cyclic phosphate phosphodiesterase